MSTRYALNVAQLKELAHKQSEALWKIRQHIQTKNQDMVQKQLEMCIPEAYGRLDIADLLDDLQDAYKTIEQAQQQIRNRLNTGGFVDLSRLMKVEAISATIAQSTASLIRYFPKELAEEVEAIAEERGYHDLVQRSKGFQGTILDDQQLSPDHIVGQLKQCQDVDEIRALLNDQQAQAVSLMNRQKGNA